MTEENEKSVITPISGDTDATAGTRQPPKKRVVRGKVQTSKIPTFYGDVIDAASDLNPELEQLRRQVAALQESEHATKEQIEELASTANRVAVSGKALSALVYVPRPEDMAIRLVPSHSLERFEEYGFGRTLALLLVGLFGGAILGILSNWTTNEQFTITRISLVLMYLFGALALGSLISAGVTTIRMSRVKKQMLRSDRLWADHRQPSEAAEAEEVNQ